MYRMSLSHVDSPLCTFCKNEDETLLHMFIDCPLSVQLWKLVLENWGKFLNMSTLPANYQLLFGDTNFDSITNHVILMTKWEIYRSKLETRHPNFTVLKNSIQSVMKIEKYIATRRKVIGKHLAKWNDFPSD